MLAGETIVEFQRILANEVRGLNNISHSQHPSAFLVVGLHSSYSDHYLKDLT